MADTDINPEIYKDKQPFLSLVKIIAIVGAAYFISSTFAYLLLEAYNIEASQVLAAYKSPFDYPEMKSFFMAAQAITSLLLFIIAPLFYLYVIEKKSVGSLNVKGTANWIPFALTALIMLTSMVALEFVIRWNENINLPAFLDGFEQWAREEEETRKEITQFLTQFNSLTEFLVGMVVIALIAAIGEELLFRGLIQNKVHAISGNIHLAIWTTALLFSLFHLQFFGLFPRLLLGVLFGYIYYWSKNLWVPIFAHFVNNGLGVSLLYLHQLKYTDENLAETTSLPFTATVAALLILSGLMVSFRNHYKGKYLIG